MGATFSLQRRRGLRVLRGRRALAVRRPAPLPPKSSSPSAVPSTPAPPTPSASRLALTAIPSAVPAPGAGSCLTNPSDFNISVPPSTGGVSISPSNPTICRGQVITLTANANLTVTNYEWYANGTCIGPPFASGAGVSQVDVNPTTTTTYCVRATFGGGCGDATATTTVTVNRAPTACFTTTPNLFCAGQSVTLDPSCSEYVKSCGGSCITACDNDSDCGFLITCQSAACTHTSIWVLPVPPYTVLQGPGPSSLNPITITFPSPGEYRCRVYAVRAFPWVLSHVLAALYGYLCAEQCGCIAFGAAAGAGCAAHLGCECGRFPSALPDYASYSDEPHF
jgi:hypothetical protein